MKFRNILLILIFSTVALFANGLPDIHQVYRTVEAGNINQAHRMIEEVLRVHPNSAKAHYIDAQILVRQGDRVRANEELQRAESLAPNLPFVKPYDVTRLKQEISSARGGYQIAEPLHKQSSFPWGTLIIFIIAIAILFMVFKAFSARRNNNQRGINPNNPAHPYSGQQGYGNTSGGGFGSGIFGGLMSGLAAGTGFAAGESLFNHFSSDERSEDISNQNSDNDFTSQSSFSDDNDFGISDDASWDDVGDSDMGDSW